MNAKHCRCDIETIRSLDLDDTTDVIGKKGPLLVKNDLTFKALVADRQRVFHRLSGE